MRSANYKVPCQLCYFVVSDIETELLKRAGDARIPFLASALELVELFNQLSRCVVDEVAEYVHRAGRIFGADLDTGNKLDSKTIGSCARFRQTRDCIVIGHRYGAHS